MLNRSLFPGADDGFRVVAPEADESVHAYMHRLARAYGLPSVKPLLRAVSLGGSRPFSIACAARLAELGGVHIEMIRRLAGFDAAYEAGVNVWTFGHERTSCFPGVNCRSLPICCECLRMQAGISSLVHLSAVTACPVHGCRLVHVCPKCQLPLRADRSQLDRCRCRFAFGEFVSEKVTQDEQILASAIHARTAGFASTTSMLNATNGQFNLAALDLDDLVYLHWAVGHVLPNPRHCALGTRRRLNPGDCRDAAIACVAVLRNPGEAVPLLRAWWRLFSDRSGTQGAMPLGLFQSLLKRLMRMRGISMLSRLIAEEFELQAVPRRHSPSIGRRVSPQLELFEESA